MEAFRLDGQNAMVTGASRGLGLAMATALAEAGANVAMAVREPAHVQAAAARIAGATGRRVAPIRIDVTDGSSVEAAVASASDVVGPLDVLVNNAGIERQLVLAEMAPNDWDGVLSTNLSSVFACARAFIAQVRGPAASIINIASIGAFAGVSGQSAYCASKGGVVSVTRALAIELAPRGIRVNAIAPGYFDTDMPAEVTSDPEARSRLLRRVPLRRLGEPHEIGPLVVYLASSASVFMTGSTINFDGGYTAQ